MISRRGFLRRSVGAVGASALTHGAMTSPASAMGCGADFLGPLQAPDANGLMLPAGFTSRILAVSNVTVPGTSYSWHVNPDGGATFATADGGWVYVSNSERVNGGGGVSALRFDAAGNVVDAYSILNGTTRNCAGGPTPWGTWLSCEERDEGEVYECDPLSAGSQGVVRPALGKFSHEAAAVDFLNQRIYLTEDKPEGLLYRFTPTSYPSLSSGVLEAAEILDPQGEGPISPGQTRPLAWHVVPDPTLSFGSTPTREQVPDATSFDGGEGCWYASGNVYFSTKGSNRVWRIHSSSNTISILYDLATSTNPQLSGVDNLYVSPCGDVLVAEDPGDLQIVALTPSGGVKPIVQLAGVSGTEITGPALSPNGSRLYFSSQRNPGATYEVRGQFLPMPQGMPIFGGVAGGLAVAALASVGAFLAGRRAELKSRPDP